MEERLRPRSFLPVLLAAVVLACSAWVSNEPSAAVGSVTAVFRPLASISERVLESDAAVMQKRLVTLGDAASRATATNGVIDVRLVGVADTQAVLSVLGAPAQLYFRPVLCDAPKYTAPSSSSTGSTSQTPIPTCAGRYRFTSADYQSSSSASFNWPDTDPVFSSYPTTLPSEDNPMSVVVLVSAGQTPSARVVLGPAEVLYRGKSELVTDTIIKSAFAQLDTSNRQWLVIFDFTATGSNVFNADAERYYGTPIADDLDGKVISAPIIEARSFPGEGEVSGNFTKELADALAAELNSGALPADIEMVSNSK